MKWLTLLIGLLISLPGFAQHDSIPWSRLIFDQKKSGVENLLLANDSTLFMVRSRFARFMGPEVLFVEQYSVPDFEQSYSKPLIMPVVNGRETDLIALAQLDTSLFAFVRYYSKPDARHRIYAQYINRMGDSDGRPRLLQEIKLEDGRKPGRFELTFSDDALRAALVYYPPRDRKAAQTLSVTLFDNHLKPVWKQELEIPYPQETLTLGDPVLDNFHNLFFQARVTDPDRVWTAGKPNFHYLILGCFTDANQVREFEVKLPKRSVSTVHLHASPNGNMLIGGLYSNLASTERQSDGVFYLDINPKSGTIERTTMLDYTPEVKRPFLTDRELEKNRELEDFVITDIVPLSSGAVLLMTERQYHRQRCASDPRTGTLNCTDHYYFGDIMALMVEADGKSLSAVRVPKSQHSTNDFGPYSSFAMPIDGELPSLYFLDNSKNTDSDQTASPRSMQNQYSAQLFRLDLKLSGQPVKTPLESLDEQSIPKPKMQLRMSDGRVLIFGVQKRGYRFAVLSGR